MPNARIPSPARSQGPSLTPRRNRSRRSNSVNLPAPSNASGRLTALIKFNENNMDSLELSPMNSRLSVLTDNTEVEEPKRKSWWKKLDDNPRDVLEVLDHSGAVETNNILELDFEVMSPENKNYSLDVPDSSGSESICSIVIPPRKLFGQKENVPQNKFDQLVITRESMPKNNETKILNQDKTLKADVKTLFGHRTKITEPIFPAGLLNISNKTKANKTKEMLEEPSNQVRKLFGNRPATKRKNMFADFHMSERDDEIPEIQPRLFTFQKKVETCVSNTSRGVRQPSLTPNVTTEIEMDEWKMLPSSTMVENQLEDFLTGLTPVKKARLSKLSQTHGSKIGTNMDVDTEPKHVLHKSSDKLRRPSYLTEKKTITEEIQNENGNQEPDINQEHINDVDEEADDDENDFTLTYDEDNKPTELDEKETAGDKQTNANNIENDRTLTQAATGKEINDLNEMAISAVNDKAGESEEEIKANNQEKGNLKLSVEDEIEVEQQQVRDNNQNKTQTEQGKSELKKQNKSIKNKQNDKLTESCDSKINNDQQKDEQFEQNVEEEVEIGQHVKYDQNVSVVKEKNGSKDKSEGPQNKSQMKVSNVQIDSEVEHQHNYEDENIVEKNESQAESNNEQNDSEVEQQNDSEDENGEELNESQVEASNKHIDSEVEQHDDSDDENDDVQNKSQVEVSNEHNDSEVRNQDDSEDDENDDIQNESHVEASNDQNESEVEQQDDSEGENDNIQNESEVEASNEQNDSQIEQQNDSEDENDDEQNESQVEASNEQNDSQVEQQDVSEDENDNEQVEASNEQNDSQAEQQIDSEDENDVEQNESQVETSNEQNDSQVEQQDVSEDENDNEQNESQVEASNEQNDSQLEQQDDSEDENDNEQNDSDAEQQIDSEDENNDEQNESQVEASNEQNESQEESDEQEMDVDDVDNLEENENDSHNANQEIQNESEEENVSRQAIEKPEEISETPNTSHDTTGRNRKRNDTQVRSPEAVLDTKSHQLDSFMARGRNTSIRKTKSIRNLNVSPTLAPIRDSIGITDGTKDSSAEGSGWDSHRTTRKTLRQTLGKEFTLRKSLRTLVMEKSAKRHTEYNEDIADVASSVPQANSTEFHHSYRDAEDVVDEPDTLEESNHEASRVMRQQTLEIYLQEVKKRNMEERNKIKEAVNKKLEASLKAARTQNQASIFKVPARPKPTKPKSKPKTLDRKINLPAEILEDMQYKPPKRFRPSNASWLTKRLYKFLETKLEPRYDYKARVRAEQLAETIYNFTKEVRRHQTAPTDMVHVLKHEMARLNIVRTHFDFYEFFHDFMPREIRTKVVPDLINKIPLPRHGVFTEIL